MKKRKMLALVLAAATVAGMMAGCGGNKESDTPEATSGSTTTDSASGGESSGDGSDVSGTVVFAHQNDTTGAIKAMIEAFNEKYPNITVEDQALPGSSDDVKKSLMTTLAVGGSDIDVIEADSIWVSQFAAAGWLEDLTEFLDPIKDQYLAGPLQTCYYNDKAYALPSYTDVGLLYYRSDLIETAPTTWDELVAMCQEHQGKDGIEYGFVFQAQQGEPVSCNMLEFIKQNGGHDLDENGEFTMNNDNTIEALEFVEGLIADGISPESVLNAKPDDSRAIFEEGQALFMRNWTYAYANAQAETSKVAGNVGVAALPLGPNGESSSGTLGGWDYVINTYSENKEAAKVFVEFMAGEEAQKIQVQMRSTLPAIEALYDDAEVQEVLPYIADAKTAVAEAQPRPQVRDYATISSVFQQYFHVALTGNQDNASAMEAMDAELNEKLAGMQ